MAQILTTVGYGDITPAKAPGQVFVAFYVLVSLLILTNVIAEVADILQGTQKARLVREEVLIFWLESSHWKWQAHPIIAHPTAIK